MKAAAAVLFLTLGVATPGASATITYDVSGSSSLLTRTSFAPVPPGYETAPFAAGSTLTLEVDANGDGTPGDVTVVASQFLIEGTIPAGVLGYLTLDAVGVVTGGLGTMLSGSEIQWTEPASYSVDGTIQCFGIVCDLVGVPVGVPVPYATLFALLDAAPLDAISLGLWLIDPHPVSGGFEFVPTLYDSAHIDVARNRTTGEWSQALLLGGRAVPEPSLGLLFSLGALAFVLRRSVA